MSKRTIYLLLFVLILSVTLYAQSMNVAGVVVDKKTGEALIGATVVQKGTSNGTVTDIDGKFAFSMPAGSTLLISYVGYTSQEMVIKDSNPLKVLLVSNTENLEEVVVVGYGTQKVKDMTAPISTVKGSDLTRQTTTSAMSALQGKMAGVQIVNSGEPGKGPDVKIRGLGSIGEYGNPLYVVDGVFVDNIDFLSSGDIEDLTVLKDASAAAIYGVRAANGVVLVTTKKGTIDHINVSYDGYVGYQVPVNVVKLANKDQYVQMLNDANASITGYIPKVASVYPTTTDWYSQLLRNAITHSHNLDISGATEKTSYSMGVNYFYTDGIMNATNNYERYNFRARIDQKVNDIVSFGFNSVVSNFNKNIPNNDAFFQAFVNPPVYNVRDAANTAAFPIQFGSPQQFGFGNQYGNPVATAYYNNNNDNGLKMIFSTYAEFNLINQKLKFRTSYNFDYETSKAQNYTPQFNVGGSQGITQSNLTKTFTLTSKQIIDNLLTYTDKIGPHSFSVLLGQSTRIEKQASSTGTAINVPGFDDQSIYLKNGSFDNRFSKDDGYRYNALSYFTRGTYNLSDKYLATVTFRADGSSKYQDKWGYFPSIGLGWIMSSEEFMKNQTLFQYLKARASYGLLGNDNIPANSAVILGTTGAASSAIFGNVLIPGVGAQTVYQNYLKWEVVNEFDLGFDFNIINQKIKGSLDYYNRITNNVVFSAPIATGGGVAELLANNGTVQNQGVELSLSWTEKIDNDLSYTIGFNATTIANKVLALNGRDSPIPGALIRGNYATQTQVGYPIGAFFGYQVAGVYASEAAALQDPVSQTFKDAGYFKYKDQNGDNVIDEKDKVYLGSAIPWLTSGVDFGLNYKKIDMSVTLQGQFGNKILNAKRMNRDVFADANYDLNFYQNAWTPTHLSTTYPSAAAYNKAFIQQANSFFVEDGSYVRIENIQVGYTFEKLMGLKNLRVYISAQRPFTYFTYNGFSPEVSGRPTENGVDTNVYPMQAVYSVGLKLNL